MAEIIVSKRKEQFAATRNGRKVAEGKTQNSAAYNGQKKYPGDTILAQRVRDTEGGDRDKLRRIHPTKPTK